LGLHTLARLLLTPFCMVAFRARCRDVSRVPGAGVRYGEPLRFERVAASSREAQQAVADDVLGAVRELYASLKRTTPERRRLAAEPHRPR
jgi:hypothetical protein